MDNTTIPASAILELIAKLEKEAKEYQRIQRKKDKRKRIYLNG